MKPIPLQDFMGIMNYPCRMAKELFEKKGISRDRFVTTTLQQSTSILNPIARHLYMYTFRFVPRHFFYWRSEGGGD